MLFQQKCTISQRPVTVEFYRLYSSYKIIAIFDDACKETLEIPEAEGTEFFSSHNYDYQGIAGMLIIEDGKLVVDLPTKKSPSF